MLLLFFLCLALLFSSFFLVSFILGVFLFCFVVLFCFVLLCFVLLCSVLGVWRGVLVFVYLFVRLCVCFVLLSFVLLFVLFGFPVLSTNCYKDLAKQCPLSFFFFLFFFYAWLSSFYGQPKRNTPFSDRSKIEQWSYTSCLWPSPVVLSLSFSNLFTWFTGHVRFVL